MWSFLSIKSYIISYKQNLRGQKLKINNLLKTSLVSIGLIASSALFAATPNLSTEVTIDKLELPWDMAFTSNGTMFFTEKCKGLSVKLPSGAVNKLHGIGGSVGYASSSEDLFCDM